MYATLMILTYVILQIGLTKNNFTLYIGIGITVAVLTAAAVIFYVWCRYKSSRPGYTSARPGKVKDRRCLQTSH